MLQSLGCVSQRGFNVLFFEHGIVVQFSSVVHPYPSKLRMCSTDILVPLITGFPTRIFSSTMMRDFQDNRIVFPNTLYNYKKLIKLIIIEDRYFLISSQAEKDVRIIFSSLPVMPFYSLFFNAPEVSLPLICKMIEVSISTMRTLRKNAQAIVQEQGLLSIPNS